MYDIDVPSMHNTDAPTMHDIDAPITRDIDVPTIPNVDVPAMHDIDASDQPDIDSDYEYIRPSRCRVAKLLISYLLLGDVENWFVRHMGIIDDDPIPKLRPTTDRMRFAGHSVQLGHTGRPWMIKT